MDRWFIGCSVQLLSSEIPRSGPTIALAVPGVQEGFGLLRAQSVHGFPIVRVRAGSQFTAPGLDVLSTVFDVLRSRPHETYPAPHNS